MKDLKIAILGIICLIPLIPGIVLTSLIEKKKDSEGMGLIMWPLYSMLFWCVSFVCFVAWKLFL